MIFEHNRSQESLGSRVCGFSTYLQQFHKMEAPTMLKKRGLLELLVGKRSLGAVLAASLGQGQRSEYYVLCHFITAAGEARGLNNCLFIK